MACLNACSEENSPIPPKKNQKNLSVISDPQISDYFLWLSWLQSIIQNFFCLLVSSEERSLLKQRQRLLPMGKRGTWAFTLCNTLEFCRVIKKDRGAFLNGNFPFSAGSWRQVLQSHRAGCASFQGCVSWQRSGTCRETHSSRGGYRKPHHAHPEVQLSIPHHPIISKLRGVREMPVVWLEQLKECLKTPLICLWDAMGNNSTK